MMVTSCLTIYMCELKYIGSFIMVIIYIANEGHRIRIDVKCTLTNWIIYDTMLNQSNFKLISFFIQGV